MKPDSDYSSPNDEARRAWDENAEFWDSRMGEGNDFVELLIWPSVEKLLALQPGERVLDVACGNGLTSRRMAARGAQVVAVDFSKQMIERARSHNTDIAVIDYRILDATNYDELVALRERSFDAALCNMALFDMAEIGPLMRSLATVIRPGGRFVFSVIHPCFNNPSTVQMAEMEDRDGEITTTYSIKVRGYMSDATKPGVAIPGQPVAHPYFHRPLSRLLEPAFKAGMILDALEERAFPPEHSTGTFPLSWGGHFSEIPPVMVARMRIP
jgi:2-polyprenyl-3-methyl-5-hydroxy-6-metoxy-1,4-benzoquinol methylase